MSCPSGAGVTQKNCLCFMSFLFVLNNGVEICQCHRTIYIDGKDFLLCIPLVLGARVLPAVHCGGFGGK